MSDHERDKLLERDRYEARAAAVLKTSQFEYLDLPGAAGVPEDLRTPYAVYENHILRLTRPGTELLDVCCGNGQHSLIAAANGARITVSDIAPQNVELTLRRGKLAGWTLQGRVADAEHLPWPDASFDLITCAGSLSYVDHVIFFREIARLLRAGGSFVCVDSLNHNPIYRLNRYIHYLRGYRSLSTLERMPELTTLAYLEREVGPVEVSFHGIFSFVSQLLIPLIGRNRCSRFVDFTDRMLPWLNRYAFKFVAVAKKL